VLPDGIFSNQKSKFGLILEGLERKDIGLVSAILRPNDVFYGDMVHVVVVSYIFSRFGMLHREKSGIPGLEPSNTCHLLKLSPS
jgi:hypothetical protein